MILIVHRNPRIVSIHRVVCGSRVISQWPSKRRLVWRSIFLWSLTSPSAWVVTLVTPWTMRLAARLFRTVICVLPRYVLQPLLRVAWAKHSEVLLNGVVCLHDRKVWPFFCPWFQSSQEIYYTGPLCPSHFKLDMPWWLYSLDSTRLFFCMFSSSFKRTFYISEE